MMNKSQDEIARDLFQERIRKGMLGPGSDVFVNESEIENEIIGNYPLQQYYTGILFPDRQRIASLDELADFHLASETGNEDEDMEDEIKQQEEEDLDDQNNEHDKENKTENDDEIKVSHSTFYPTNIGLTFCVADNVKEIDVIFSFGIYTQLDEKEKYGVENLKVQFPEHLFDETIKNNEHFPSNLKDKLECKNGYLFLTNNIVGKKRRPRSSDYADFDAYQKEFRNRIETTKIEKLFGRTWLREPIQENRKIHITDLTTPEPLYERIITKKNGVSIRISYTLKTYTHQGNPGCKYVKIQLVNSSTEQPANKYSNANEILNQKCVFQAKIEVQNTQLQPFKSYSELNPLDEEAELLNFLYKDKFSFGIGHNCSVEWQKDASGIATSFLPQYDVKDTKNSFEQADFDNQNDYGAINECLDIDNLSHFTSDTQEVVLKRLNDFVNLYEKWLVQQKSHPSTNKKIEDSIFQNLNYNLERLRSNIERLKDTTLYKAFQLANTAMLIQIIISNDADLSGKEKELEDINQSLEYAKLNFFKDYDFTRLPFNRPKYRPFQLAFLLLNIDSITDIESETRNEIVDLIWFPTGGGKTEAYLAVAAFTIVYRRLTNATGYEGTSVIMRYTLRLLTAQQFERASRLICALEFLRCHFIDELKDEPITIGMWVGMSSTPNTIKETLEKEEEIREECNKLNSGNNGNPESKNVFQISACSWCGTKLITKNQYGNWTSGFQINGNSRNASFTIKCVNNKCHFHNELPIQVVDEMLYRNPPTLLFGTVDKFAMLAWKSNGHRFFNSLDVKKMPPDLIIQDELHLLTGPLGSITGIFESVIEILCTKDGRKPKIISSTATTRNTDEQVRALYGTSRKVNIFPPNGLSYADSFFAKEAKSASKRRYIGFLPTGKSSIDTQLQLLAHLFVSRLEAYKLLIKEGDNDYDTFDKYWTIVSYYNSLKDVGKIHNKVGDEISNFTSTLQQRLFGNDPNQAFNYSYLYNRDEELTSRIESAKIKQTLKRLEENTFTYGTIVTPKSGRTYVQNIIDLVLATNMISVGIDIDRFNIMLINGQPRNVAEYIQASSRVGRKYKGLVVNLFDANRARDKSHFEHFVPFHQAFYKGVEPLSLTPLTENTLEKMLTSVMITYLRHKIPGMAADDAAQHFKPEMLDRLKSEIQQRFGATETLHQLLVNKLDQLAEDWTYKIEEHSLTKYDDGKDGLLVKPSQKDFGEDQKWAVMQSMREIDTNSFIKKELPKIRNNG